MLNEAFNAGATFILFGMTISLAVGYMLSLRKIRRLERSREMYRSLARKDELTGVHNRRAGMDRLRWAVKAASQNTPLRNPAHAGWYAIIMVDLKGFGQINRDHGHVIGDRLLKSFAAMLEDAVRRSNDTIVRLGDQEIGGSELDSLRRSPETVVRQGGDEFLVILPGTRAAGAQTVLDRIRLGAAEVRITSEDGRVIVNGLDVHARVGERRGSEGEDGMHALLAEVGQIKK